MNSITERKNSKYQAYLSIYPCISIYSEL